MNQRDQDLLLDLLTKKAMCGLDEREQLELDKLHAEAEEMEFRSLELTAAAIGVAGTPANEPLPAHLYSKIIEDAGQYVGAHDQTPVAPWPPAKDIEPGYDTILSPRENVHPSSRSWFEWTGWAVAAAACIALVTTIWLTQAPRIDQANIKPAAEPNKLTAQLRDPAIKTPSQSLSPEQMREEMMRSSAGIVKANWSAGNPKELKEIVGDVVWSDEKQAGYVRLNGLPINDGTKETYQLWIFDKTQDKATPIDGGTFDIRSNDEVVIAINAKLKIKEPEMFAITVEKPGGVVVSKRERLIATAKIDTP